MRILRFQVLMSTVNLNFLKYYLNLSINLRYLSQISLYNVLKQPVDDSFCLNPLELERIVEILMGASTVIC